MHLVILPGWNHSHFDWQQVSKALQSHGVSHTVLDVPGFGAEPHQAELLTISDMSAWLANKLTKYSTDKVVLCGHSYGGRIAAQYAASKAARLEGLILIGSPNIYRPSLSTRIKKLFSYILSPIKKCLPESFKIMFRSADFVAARGGPLQTLFENIVSNDQTKLLPNIAVPTKLLWGELDDAAPLRIATEINTLLPNSTLETVTGVGHNIHVEKPQLLAGKLTTYVRTF